MSRRERDTGLLIKAISEWWAPPDDDCGTRWAAPGYDLRIRGLWSATLPALSGTDVARLLEAIPGDREALAGEYERLFVGPAAPSCPPYESLWRTDRPIHEQGMVMGDCIREITALYGGIGLCRRPGERELADHIAIEMEALACAFGVQAGATATRLLTHLRMWVTPFCAQVRKQSRLTFYQALADLTPALIGELTSRGSPETA